MYLASLDKNSQAIRCEADMVSNLTDIIRRHNEIAQLMKKFSSIMVGIVLSHFITSSLIIGTSVIELLLVGVRKISLVFIIFI